MEGPVTFVSLCCFFAHICSRPSLLLSTIWVPRQTEPERPVTLRLFKVMRFEYKKAPHSNRVRCLECVDKKDAGAKLCAARVCRLLRLDCPFCNSNTQHLMMTDE